MLPLAIAYPDDYTKVQVLDSGTDGFSPDEVSKWVWRQIGAVSKLLGVTFEGHEREAMRLFSAIENSRRRNIAEKGNGCTQKEHKVAREL